eukprot:6839427-Pyramimonas_sp.AAC.1
MGRVGGDAHCERNATTTAPWMSLTKAMCMMSSLFTRNTAVQDNIRARPDFSKRSNPWWTSQVSSDGPRHSRVGRGMEDVTQRLVEGGWRHAGPMVPGCGQSDD